MSKVGTSGAGQAGVCGWVGGGGNVETLGARRWTNGLNLTCHAWQGRATGPAPLDPPTLPSGPHQGQPQEAHVLHVPVRLPHPPTHPPTRVCCLHQRHKIDGVVLAAGGALLGPAAALLALPLAGGLQQKRGTGVSKEGSRAGSCGCKGGCARLGLAPPRGPFISQHSASAEMVRTCAVPLVCSPCLVLAAFDAASSSRVPHSSTTYPPAAQRGNASARRPPSPWRVLLRRCCPPQSATGWHPRPEGRRGAGGGPEKSRREVTEEVGLQQGKAGRKAHSAAAAGHRTPPVRAQVVACRASTCFSCRCSKHLHSSMERPARRLPKHSSHLRGGAGLSAICSAVVGWRKPAVLPIIREVVAAAVVGAAIIVIICRQRRAVEYQMRHHPGHKGGGGCRGGQLA